MSAVLDATVKATGARLSYRSVLSVPADIDLRRILTAEVDAWLRTKGLQVSDFGPTWVDVGSGAAVIWPIDHGQRGVVRGRMRLAEARGFETRLTHVQSSGAPGWLALDIYAPQGRDARVPRLLRQLLPFINAHDGLAEVRERAVLARPEDVDDLVEVICDPDRRGVVFVAGTDESLPMDPWRDLVDRVARDTVGMAATYLLDAEATRLLDEGIGPTHSVVAGTIRTFLPSADPASRVDARRHRFLGAARLATEDPRALARILAGVAAREMVTSQLPREVVRAHRALDRIEDADLVAAWRGDRAPALQSMRAVTEVLPPASVPEVEAAASQEIEMPPEPAVADDLAAATPDTGQVEVYLALAAGLRTVLGVDEPTLEAVDQLVALAELGRRAENAGERLEQRLADLHAQLEATEDRVRELENERDDALEDFALAQEDAGELRARVRYLQQELATSGKSDVAWGDLPVDAKPRYPGSFDALLENVTGLQGVVFTGDPGKTRELDLHDQLGALADKTWDVLLALQDYVRAKAEGLFTGGLPEYLRNPPSGYRSVSANQFVAVESETVRANRSMRRQREFPVPESVDPGGTVFMEAHFRLGAKRTISPRLYLYDATGRGDVVYVGYIGRHLENTKTS